MPFVAGWMDLGIFILSEVSHKKRNIIDIAKMQNPKKKKKVQMNLFTKLSKVTHRCRKQTYAYQEGRQGRDKLGNWDWHIHTNTHKIDNQ